MKRLILLLAAVHLILTIVLFLSFGIGLEGKQHVAHQVLWVLMMPAACFPLKGLFIIPLNSLLWGVLGALLVRGLSHLME